MLLKRFEMLEVFVCVFNLFHLNKKKFTAVAVYQK
jgi:hypothetical protein